MALLYIDKVTYNQAAFAAKVIDIANKLGIDPNWLMVNMFSESGLNSAIQNSIGCVGLIQFCHDSTGTNTKNIAGQIYNLTDIKNLSNVDQLDIVYNYYAPYAGKIKSFEDLYLIDFFPAALGWSDDQVIQNANISASQIAKANPSFDTNKDGQITVGEFKAAVRKKIPFGYKTDLGRNIMSVVQPVTGDNPFVPIVIIILFIILIFLLYKRSK